MRIRLGAEELIELGRKSCGPGKIRRAAYVTKRGVAVKAKCVKDTGKRGKTPAEKRVLPAIMPGFLRGWRKNLSDQKRHAILEDVTRAEGCASTIRRLNLLANYTTRTSPETHSKAREDMAWVRNQNFCKLKGNGNK